MIIEVGMVKSSLWHQLVLFTFTLLFVSTGSGLVCAQGLPQSSYSAPDVLRRGAAGRDLAPSNPLGLPSGVGPRGSDSIYLSDQMFRDILGPIPNLQVGYLYNFGKSVRTGRLTLDYLLPITFGSNSAIFIEAHGEFTDFWKTFQRIFRVRQTGENIATQSSFDERTDLSIGGGYRRIFGETTLLGVNGFFDSSNLGGQCYSAGGLGFEFASLLDGNDALDLTFNWYGDLSAPGVITNLFRKGPENYDFQAGYSHELWVGGPDFRLYASGYRFSSQNGVSGWRTGAELKTRDGMCRIKYDFSRDAVNDSYHSIGAFVNVGFELSNLFKGENPLAMPEPIFNSPRKLEALLTQKTRRRWTGPKSKQGAVCRALIPDGAFPLMWVRGPTEPAVPDLTKVTTVTVKWRSCGSPPLWGFRLLFSDGVNRGSVRLPTAGGSADGQVEVPFRLDGPSSSPQGLIATIHPIFGMIPITFSGPDGFMCFIFN
jgi:Inverse autotransporter, beta-domain